MIFGSPAVRDLLREVVAPSLCRVVQRALPAPRLPEKELPMGAALTPEATSPGRDPHPDPLGSYTGTEHEEVCAEEPMSPAGRECQ